MLKKVNAILLAVVVLCALVYCGASCRNALVVHAGSSGQPVAYVPINITNTQSIATPSPIQVMIIVNSAEYATYEAADLSNVAFTYSNTTVIPSWLESGNSNSSTNTVYWLKVDGIPAKSSMTVLMSFYPTTDSVLDNVRTGEAPSLSPIYGEYDDGANVFILYGDFNNSLSGWQASAYQGSFMPVSSPHGVKMLDGGSYEATYLTPPKGLPLMPIEIEDAWDYNGQGDTHAMSIGPSPFETSNTLMIENDGGAPVLNNSASVVFHYFWSYTRLYDFMTGSRVSSSLFAGRGNFNVVSFLIVDGTSASAGYSTQYVSLESFGSALVPSVVSGQVSGPVSNPALIISGKDGSATSVQYVRWAIARAFPPNGVAPSVTLGNVVVLPTVESCNYAGMAENSFSLGEPVYVKGSGYNPSGTYDLYVVNATVWSDGMLIPQRVAGTATTITSDASGNIATTQIWTPLTQGNYDIVVDVNKDGYYNSSIDALDKSYTQISAGFEVIPEFPSFLLASLLIITTLTVTVRQVRRRKKET